MSFASFLSKRISLGSEQSRSWQPAVIVAVGGIAVSFMVMLAAISIVTGFKQEITAKIFAFNPLVTITPAPNSEFDTTSVPRALSSLGIENTAAFNDARVSLSVTVPALLRTSKGFMGVVLQGNSYGFDWEAVESAVIEGQLPEFDEGSSSDATSTVISQTMASKLGLGVGDRIDAYFFVGGTVRPRRFTVDAIYRSDFAEFDEVMAFADYNMLRRLALKQSEPSFCLQINGLAADEILPMAESVQAQANRAFLSGRISGVPTVGNVFSTGAIYFNWLAMLDTNIVVILVLMAFVSCFMLISSIMTVILQRVAMIGQLKALGASNGQIRDVFVRLGLRITLIGLGIGNICGIGLLWAQSVWHFLPLDPHNYYISFVPVNLSVLSIVVLNIASLVVAFAILLLPTGIIARMSPVRSLRFE